MQNLDWKKVSLYGAALFGVIILAIAYFTNSSTEKQTVAAQQAFDRWKQSPDDAALEKKMRKALANTPQLKKALQAEIAQTMLAAGWVGASEMMAEHCIEQLKKESPLHASFAATTFLIEKRQYQTALEQAVSLKQKLKAGSILHAYNLLRIALLQKQLSNKPGELAAWKEVKTLFDAKTDASSLLEANFQKRSGKKSFALTDFIAQREKTLN